MSQLKSSGLAEVLQAAVEETCGLHGCAEHHTHLRRASQLKSSGLRQPAVEVLSAALEANGLRVFSNNRIYGIRKSNSKCACPASCFSNSEIFLVSSLILRSWSDVCVFANSTLLPKSFKLMRDQKHSRSLIRDAVESNQSLAALLVVVTLRGIS